MEKHASARPSAVASLRRHAPAIFCLSLLLGAWSGGGGGGGAVGPAVAVVADLDRDGIPDAADALPNDPARLVDNATVPLAAVPGGGTFSAAYSINAGGLAVGESEAGSGVFIATAWQADGPAVPLAASVSFPKAGRSAAYGVNGRATAQIVGEATTVGGALRAVLWNGLAGAPVDLGVLPGGTFSSALAISNDGVVVGEADTATGVTHAVAWRVDASGAKTSGPVDLGVITVADVRSMALGVDASRRVVGESEDRAGVVPAGLRTQNPTARAAVAGESAMNPPAPGEGDMLRCSVLNSVLAMPA